MTTMEKPKSSNLREYCGWTGILSNKHHYLSYDNN